MERWKTPHHRGGEPAHAHHHPSFSSSLLDAIDRSIDKGGPALSGGAAANPRLHCDVRKHEAVHGRGVGGYYSQCVAEKAAVLRRRGGAVEHDPPRQHYGRAHQPQQQRERFCGNSTSSSSDSSYGGFSSSEAESVVLPAPPLPKPVRTGGVPERELQQTPLEETKQKTKGGSIRSRFRASKFYGELKKGRATPVSPGARLASFLNTLFSTAGNPKKAKISTPVVNPAGGAGRGGGDESACSSASSYSRSCLSKTPSSRGKTASSSGGGTKRSVRFYPVSVIVDEDCRPCGQKCLYEDEKPGYFRRIGGLSVMEPQLAAIRVREEPRLTPPPPLLTSYRAAATEAEERKRAREAARDLVTTYKEKKRGLGGFEVDDDDDEEDDEEDDDEDDDDAASYSSSDLFELKNLASIGGGEMRYRDELPVYETTRLDTNRAIAQGLLGVNKFPIS